MCGCIKWGISVKSAWVFVVFEKVDARVFILVPIVNSYKNRWFINMLCNFPIKIYDIPLK